MNQLVTEARALCERATKGPWTLIKEGRYEDHDECRIDLPDDNIELCRYENGELVARSRTLIPEMADEIERLEAELDALKSLLRSKRLVSVDSVLDIIGETAAEALAAMKEDAHESHT